MNLETRRRALRAAAKVAFGAALVGALPGCGGRVELDSALAPSSDDSGAPVSDAAVSDVISTDAPLADVGLRCVPQIELGTGNPPTPSSAITEAQFACCARYDDAEVASLAAADQIGTGGFDPSFVNCCRAIIARIDTGLPLGVDPSPAREACCSGGLVAPTGELWGHLFCAPWGPPVPPALTDSLEIRA